MGWLPVLAAMLVVLPWSVAIGLKEPDFWHFFFWNEHIRRFLGGAAQHKAPLWYFLTIAPAVALPWTFLVPAAVQGLRGRVHAGRRERRLIKFCICWLVCPFVFFSISKGKLLTYILPCFPPFAILMAIGLELAVRERKTRWIQWGIAATGILFLTVAAAFVWIQLFGFQGIRPYDRAWKALMVVNGLLFMIVLCLLALKSRMNMKKIFVFGISPLLLFFIGHFTIPGQTLVSKAPGPFLERLKQGLARDSIVVSDEDSVRAICWYLKRDDLYLTGGAGELDYGLGYPEALKRLISLDTLGETIERHRGKLVLVARSENIERWKPWLPKPKRMDSSGVDGYALWNY